MSDWIEREAAIASIPEHWFHGPVFYEMMKDAICALPAQPPAQGVRVKALLWREIGPYPSDVHEGGIYRIYQWQMHWRVNHVDGHFNTLTAAKAAAQADYTARILAAIEPAPLTVADAALVNAATMMVRAYEGDHETIQGYYALKNALEAITGETP